MNLIKEMDITLSGLVGAQDTYREAVMLKKLLQDAGVKNVIINGSATYSEERHDDEIKLFMGAKPDKIIIHVREYFIGG